MLLFQTLRDTSARTGLPRPLCILAGNTDVYPYFDAPVTGIEDPEAALGSGLDTAGSGAEREGTGGSSQYASLLMSRIPRAKKRAVLVLEESIDETEVRVAKLRGLVHEDARPATEQADIAASGSAEQEIPATQEPSPIAAAEAHDDPDAMAEAAKSDAMATLHNLLKTKPRTSPPGDGWSSGSTGARPGFDLIDFDEPAGREQTFVRFKLDTTIFAETLRASAAPVADPAMAPVLKPVPKPELPDAPVEHFAPNEPSWPQDGDSLFQQYVDAPRPETIDTPLEPDVAVVPEAMAPQIEPAPHRPAVSEHAHPFRHAKRARREFAGPAWLGKLIDRYRALTARWRV